MARIWRGWVQRVTCSYQYLPRAEAAERLRQGLGSYGSARRPRHTLLDQMEQVYRAVRAIIGVVKLEMAPMMLAPGRCARAAGLKLRQLAILATRPVGKWSGGGTCMSVRTKVNETQ